MSRAVVQQGSRSLSVLGRIGGDLADDAFKPLARRRGRIVLGLGIGFENEGAFLKTLGAEELEDGARAGQQERRQFPNARRKALDRLYRGARARRRPSGG